uniref:RRP12 HEAT domain-containing protein n=1 Tax=Arcella intermedia TaxID=1963864 RepID=A0A6B2KX19_9EUKA
MMANEKENKIFAKKENDGEEGAEEKNEHVERCKAAFRLMALVCPKLSDMTFKKVSPDLVKLMVDFFKKSPPATLARSGIELIRSLFSWTHPLEDQLITRLFRILVDQVVTGRPKNRKVSLDIIYETLENRPELVVSILLPCIQSTILPIVRQCKQDNTLTTLHALYLLQNLSGFLPNSSIKSIAENALRLPILGHGMVNVCLLKVFGSFFETLRERNASGVTKKGVVGDLTEDLGLAAALVNALFDLKLNFSDGDVLIAFGNAIMEGFVTLAKLEPPLAAKKLPQLVKDLLPTFQGENNAANVNTGNVLGNILNACVTKEMIVETVEGGVDAKEKHFLLLINYLRSGLKYTYQVSWEPILGVIQAFFKATAANIPAEKGEVIKNALVKPVADLIRDIAYLREGRWENIAEQTLASSLSTIGIKNFLEILILKFPSIDYPSNEKPSVDNLWILPFLKRHLSHSELSFFLTKFLPISQELEANAKKATAKGDHLEAQILQTIYLQIWELFPAFSTYPTDIPITFKKIAKLLCTALLEKPNLRAVVSTGILFMINKNKALLSQPEKSVGSNPKDNINAIAVFSKNFLPGLFNVLIDDIPPNERNHIYNTTEAFISISDKPLITATFNNVVGKLIKESTDQTKIAEKPKEASAGSTLLSRLADISVIFVQHIEMANVELLFKTVRPLLTARDTHLQKKTFKVLISICQHHRVLVNANFNECIKILEETEPKTSNNATKKFRSKLMKILFEEAKTLDVETLKRLLPEVILNTREVNATTREISHQIIDILGEKFNSTTPSQINHLIGIVAAGLTLDARFISATMSILSILLKKYAVSVSAEMKQDIITTTVLFFRSTQREVLHATLECWRKILSIYKDKELKEVLSGFFEAVWGWDDITKTKLHNELKVVLEKLLRKMGYEELLKIAGNRWMNLLRNIRKSYKREKKKKSGKNEKGKEKKEKKKDKMEDSSSSSDDSSDSENDEMKAADPKGTWVVEGKTDDDIIDFLESSANQHVVSKDPNQQTKKKKVHDDFKFTDDGKFIVDDLMEEENKKKEKGPSLKEQMEARVNLPINRSRQRLKRIKAETYAPHSALRYKNKKAGGDLISKTAKYEPYSYTPLDPKQLNKRRLYGAHKKYQPLMLSSKGRIINKKKQRRSK